MNLHKYLYILLYIKICIICQQVKNNIYTKINNDSIKNTVYIIKNKEGNLYLKYNDSTFRINEHHDNIIQNFILIKDKDIIINNNTTNEYYYIKEKSSNIILSSSTNEENKIIKYNNDINRNYSLWKIISKINEQNQLIYYIQNKKTKKYWYLDSNIKQIILKEKYNLNINKNNEFQFIKLYKEVEYKNKNSILLDKEPIDILIKYLNREDKFNEEELKYCIKNIFKNMSWIRKIYILIYNFNDKFFIPNIIDDKIIYVKIKKLLDFESTNLFRLNLLKMKKYNLSENFILMENSVFITTPLQKNNFFCEENDIILPCLISNEYNNINKIQIQNELNKYLINKENNITSKIGLNIRQKRTLLLLYKIFSKDNIRKGKKIIQPKFAHNIIPLKMSDISNIYDYIHKYSKHSDIMKYTANIKNKYDNKVSKIPPIYFDSSKKEKLKNTTSKIFINNKLNQSYNIKLNINKKRILNELNNNIRYTNRLNDVKKMKNIDEKMLNKIKKIDENMSSLFNGMNNLIDKMSIVMNKTLINYNIKNNYNENNNKDIILKEIEYLKKEYKYQIFINIILFCIIIFFIINIIFILYKNRNKNINIKIKRKYKKHRMINY